MITNIRIENCKKLENISFQLSSSVVIVGPNNSGKSTVLQALCLWELGVKSYMAAYKRNYIKKTGRVTVNRRDLLNTPVLDARSLWRNMKVTTRNGNDHTVHLPLVIELSGKQDGIDWNCKAEFISSNTESFSCKIVTGLEEIIELYDKFHGIQFGFLQAMSGIVTNEDKLAPGGINRKLGEGRTAEVLRNICYQILYPESVTGEDESPEKKWTDLCNTIDSMFGIKLEKPEYDKVTGLLHLNYIENGIKYDISSGGRGFLQTLLLFAYMFSHPNTVLLLDEPDAHLESIRQRETFRKINEIADETHTQVIITSHSEVVMNEAAEKSHLVALIENQVIPLNTSTGKQSFNHIRKALTEIGWDKYYLARTKGHVLYLEGSTDLSMLLAFANKLSHRVEPLLRTANVQYTSDNVVGKVIDNFASLQEVFNELRGLALFDRIKFQPNPKLEIICWERRELENYFASPELLLKHARLLCHPKLSSSDLEEKMRESITNYTKPVHLSDPNHEWWTTAKLSDEWLDEIFSDFYKKLDIPVGKNFKKTYYKLIALMNKEDIPKEVREKLDTIYVFLNPEDYPPTQRKSS
jgi:ABC-type cobalamin/Fe3+-siderophores transport system ATPase subunit